MRVRTTTPLRWTGPSTTMENAQRWKSRSDLAIESQVDRGPLSISTAQPRRREVLDLRQARMPYLRCQCSLQSSKGRLIRRTLVLKRCKFKLMRSLVFGARPRSPTETPYLQLPIQITVLFRRKEPTKLRNGKQYSAHLISPLMISTTFAMNQQSNLTSRRCISSRRISMIKVT